MHCLPTFFEQIGPDILNPRNKETRAGSTPISLEVVRAGARGLLSMVYVPFDLIGKPAAEIARERASRLDAKSPPPSRAPDDQIRGGWEEDQRFRYLRVDFARSAFEKRTRFRGR